MGDNDLTENELEDLLKDGKEEDSPISIDNSKNEPKNQFEHPDFLVQDTEKNINSQETIVTRNWSWQGTDKSVTTELFKELIKHSVPIIGASVYKKVALGEIEIKLLTKAEVKTTLNQDFIVFTLSVKNFFDGEFSFLISQENGTQLLNMINSTNDSDLTEENIAKVTSIVENFIQQIHNRLVEKIYNEMEINLKENKIISKTNNDLILSDYSDNLLYIKSDLFIEQFPTISLYFLFPIEFLDILIPLLKYKAAYELEKSRYTDKTKLHGISLPSLGTAIEQKNEKNSSLLLDVQMPVTVELGKTKMYIKDILSLGEGSIIELDKLAGEPVDLFVNDKLIAKGEVVVIDENFGVRVTDIINPMSRIKAENINLD